MQTEDLTKLTNPIGIDPSRPDLTPLRVSDGSQPLETDSGGLSGGFHPQKLEPLDPPDKNSKNAETYLDPAMI